MRDQIAQTPIGICEVRDKELFFGRALRRRIFRCASYTSTIIEEIANKKKGRIFFEPIGVVGIITPWNYPLLTLSERLPFCLAAGLSLIHI